MRYYVGMRGILNSNDLGSLSIDWIEDHFLRQSTLFYYLAYRQLRPSNRPYLDCSLKTGPSTAALMKSLCCATHVLLLLSLIAPSRLQPISCGRSFLLWMITVKRDEMSIASLVPIEVSVKYFFSSWA